MPLEVVDARSEFPDVLRKRASWDSAEYTKEAAVVRRILEEVRERGDEALVDYTQQFDGCDLTPDGIRVSARRARRRRRHGGRRDRRRR